MSLGGLHRCVPLVAPHMTNRALVSVIAMPTLQGWLDYSKDETQLVVTILS